MQHGAGGYRIGRRQDRAQRDAGGPGQFRHQQPGHDRHNRRGEEDGANRQRKNAGHVPPEWRDRGEPRAVHQQGREKQDKHELRIDRDPLHTRYEGDGASADDQRGCWWQRQTPGQIVKPQHHQEHQDDQLEIRRWMHKAAPFPCPPGGPASCPERRQCDRAAYRVAPACGLGRSRAIAVVTFAGLVSRGIGDSAHGNDRP